MRTALDELFTACTALLQSPTLTDHEYGRGTSGRGYYYYKKSLFRRSLEEYEKAIAKFPNDVVLLMGRGRAFMALGFADKALRDINRAIEINPARQSSYLYRGHIYSRLNQLEDALRDYNKVLRLKPKSGPRKAYLANSLCWTYGLKGEGQMALKHCNHALQIMPGNPQYLDSRAFAYFKLGRLDEALKDSNQAITSYKKKNWRMHQLRGAILDRMGEKKRAKREIMIARSLQPSAEEFNWRARHLGFRITRHLGFRIK